MTGTSACSFDFSPRTRIVFGGGSLDRLGELARGCGGRRALLVTDSGIIRAGHVARAEASLTAAGMTVSLFDRVVENPSTRVVEDCVAQARADRIDLLIGLGGGSSMDAAKGCNFLLTNGGKMEDYWGVGKAGRPMLPLIAVPTTAGTGSECQSYALISQEETHVKMACGDPKAAPKVAILDPVLTLTQPPGVAACTGIDALSHAVETAVTTRRNRLSAMFSREAFALCSGGLARVFSRPDDLEARGEALLGAALAGMAIENSMLGAAHAAANPLTARFGVPHGQAVGLMLPAVVRFNGQLPEVRRIYEELASVPGIAEEWGNSVSAAEALAQYLEKCLARAGLRRSLAELEIGTPDLEGLAKEAAGQWTAQFNPRPAACEDFIGMYQSVSGN